MQPTEDFLFTSKYVNVHGSRMHYIEAGTQGPTVLFIHGLPTWSYLWRNIIPGVSQHARCFALDLIGLGRSDKPDLTYSLADHIRYVEGFIEALGLKEVVLVMHAWGSTIGFDVASRQEKNIRGLAFLEAHLRPPQSWDMVSLPVQEISSVLALEDGGYDQVMHKNLFIEKILPRGIMRRLTEKEKMYYEEPFTQPGSCLPLWQYLQEIPVFQNDKKEILDRMADYSHGCKKHRSKIDDVRHSRVHHRGTDYPVGPRSSA